MQHVLSHPEFKSNPILAITQHLTATMPPPPEPKVSEVDEKQRRKEKKKKAKAKKALEREDAAME